jgi:hypothetical protein
MPSRTTDPYGIGDAKKDVVRGPGVENTNLTLFKNIPWGEGAKAMQFRFEAYNAFNHTQFNSVDTNTNFDPATGNQLNTDFGAYTGPIAPRRNQNGIPFRGAVPMHLTPSASCQIVCEVLCSNFQLMT